MYRKAVLDMPASFVLFVFQSCIAGVKIFDSCVEVRRHGTVNFQSRRASPSIPYGKTKGNKGVCIVPGNHYSPLH